MKARFRNLLLLDASKGFHPETIGLAYRFLGVLTFSLTLPATRIAVLELDPTIVGLGRAIVAAILAVVLLKVTRQPRLSQRHLPGLIIFPAFIDQAMVGVN